MTAPILPKTSTWLADEQPVIPRLSRQGPLVKAGLAVSVVLGVSQVLLAFIYSDRYASGISHGLLFLAIPFLYLASLRDPATTKDDSYIDDPDDELGELVDVRIYQDGVVTGEDRGMMTIIEDAIIFVGKRCTFSLGSQDIRRHSPQHDGSPPLESSSSSVLRLLHPHREVLLHILLVRSNEKSVVRQKLIRELEISPNAMPTDFPSLYPPLSKDPKIPIPGKWRDPIYASFLVALFLAACGVESGQWEVIAFVAPVLAIGLLFWKEPETRRRARAVLTQLSTLPANVLDSDQTPIIKTPVSPGEPQTSAVVQEF